MKNQLKKWKAPGIIFVTFAALILTAAYTDSVKADEEEQEVICDGMFLDSINVSGLTQEEARAEYERYMSDLKSVTVSFRLKEEECTVNMDELDLQADLDAALEEAYAYGRTGNILRRFRDISDIANEQKHIDVELSFNEEYLVQVLDEALADYIIPPKDATIEYADGDLKIVEGESGNTLNAEKTVDELRNAIQEWSGADTLQVTVATDEMEPEHTAADLQGITDEIGMFETHYSAGDVSRNNNIMNAANKISGTVLYPGEEFDTMAHLVPFTTDNGWSYAGAYLNGEVISDIGGGICQVSTTLYNAVLQAELEVTERYPHSMAVGYVQLSADAALNEGTKNFRFVNNTEHPIYVYAYASGGTLHVSIYGKEYRDENRTIEYKNEILSVIPAGDPIETVDETQPSDYRNVTQTAHTGYRANLWKYIYENGELVDTVLVNTSYYSASPERVTIGPPAETTETSAEPMPEETIPSDATVTPENPETPTIPSDPNTPSTPPDVTDPSTDPNAQPTEPTPSDPSTTQAPDSNTVTE